MRSRCIALCTALLLGAPAALSAPPPTGHEAVALLSRYPAGSVPVDAVTITAIHTLGDVGLREDISLLRNLAENERDEVGSAARSAITEIRSRQREAQREAYAQTLPDWPDLASASAPLRKAGLGQEEASCVAYAQIVLGKVPVSRPTPEKGDALALLEIGKPRKAVAAVVDDSHPEARQIEALAWEDLGEPRAAIQQYAILAADGDEASYSEIEGFGIDTEMLLLGLLSQPSPHLAPDSEASLIEVLVRKGEYLTASVLSERLRSRKPAARAEATDALVRMLDPALRSRPMHPIGVRIAHRALAQASGDENETIRAIASEATRD